MKISLLSVILVLISLVLQGQRLEFGSLTGIDGHVYTYNHDTEIPLVAGNLNSILPGQTHFLKHYLRKKKEQVLPIEDHKEPACYFDDILS